MKFKYLVLQLSFFSITSLFGTNAAADVKTSRAEVAANETDAKVTQNSAFPYFKQWVDIRHELGYSCSSKKECLGYLQQGKPCLDMINDAREIIINSSRVGNQAYITHVYPETTSYEITAPPSDVIAQAIPVMPTVLAPIIYGYNPFERVINLVVRSTERHPVSQGDTYYFCTYNLDTHGFVINREQYECLRRIAGSSGFERYMSDTPLAPDDTPRDKTVGQ
jgi:hypothetical protein